MDYLDHRKEAEHRIILFTGYLLITLAIVMGTLILVSRAYGFGLAKNGNLTQSGLTFFSSHPHPANIYINGKPNSVRTNSRLSLQEGIYKVILRRDGYHDWQRTIKVEGGVVQHFDYPFLVPLDLASKAMPALSGAPELVTQSTDQRWLIIGQPGSFTSFLMYDLKNPDKAPTTIDLPANLLSKATTNESWQPLEWADDNQHVLLKHSFDDKTEYILLDRTTVGQSLNLNTTLSLVPDQLSLINHKFDQYYVYDATQHLLQTASLHTVLPVVAAQHVLAYQSYGSNTLLFVTDSGALSGEVLVRLAVGGHTYSLRSLPAADNYLVDLAKYDGKLYVAVGGTNQGRIYIYKDPVGELASVPRAGLIPAQVLHITQPNYLSFSDNGQYVVTENGSQFGAYDIQSLLAYSYAAPTALDAPQAHAGWMDSDHLAIVSGGKLVIFDYDGTNSQTLGAASGGYLPAFAPDYKYVYTVSPSATAGQFDMLQTALVTAGDL